MIRKVTKEKPKKIIRIVKKKEEEPKKKESKIRKIVKVKKVKKIVGKKKKHKIVKMVKVWAYGINGDFRYYVRIKYNPSGNEKVDNKTVLHRARVKIDIIEANLLRQFNEISRIKYLHIGDKAFSY